MPRYVCVLTAESLVYSDEYVVTGDDEEDAKQKITEMLKKREVMLNIVWKPSGSVYLDSGKLSRLIPEDKVEETYKEAEDEYAKKHPEKATPAIWLPGDELPVVMVKPDEAKKARLNEAKRSALEALRKSAA